MTTAVQSSGAKAPMSKPSESMTSAISEELTDDQQLDVTVGTVKRLLIMAYKQYNDAVKDGHSAAASWWDGYIRGCQHILEAEDQ
jgi:hypothetical protein